MLLRIIEDPAVDPFLALSNCALESLGFQNHLLIVLAPIHPSLRQPCAPLLFHRLLRVCINFKRVFHASTMNALVAFPFLDLAFFLLRGACPN